jgi:serine/threonine-protein kinase
MTIAIGTRLQDRYIVEEVLAQGGMGAIYKARDESLGIYVAIKENLYASQQAIRQFRREATILAGVRHPHLPRVTDHFVIENQGQYLVMDFIEGRDLHERLKNEGPIPEAEALAIGAEVCDALTYLHTRNPAIVHRDIKPGNIKITPAGHVYLVDFGLAKVSQPGEATTTGAQALTPGYAPPEQYGQGTDIRSDIYSLGAMLYAVMTNKLPEDGLARAMGSAQLTPVSAHNPAISKQTERILDKSMSIDRNQRYSSAEDFKQALLGATPQARSVNGTVAPTQMRNSIAVSTPTTSPKKSQEHISHNEATRRISQPPQLPIDNPISTSTEAFPPATKKRGKSIFFAIGALMILGLIVVGVVFGSGILKGSDDDGTQAISSDEQTPSPESVVLVNATTNTPELPPTDIIPTETLVPTETATSAPTATFTPAPTAIGGGRGQILFASDREGGIPQLWLVNSNGSDLKQITNLTDGACQPDWAPDGKRIIFTSPCREQSDTYSGSFLFIINEDGSGLSPLLSLPGGDFDPAWSPVDENLIAFTSLRQGNIPTIYLRNLADNSVEMITSSSIYDHNPSWSPDGQILLYESRPTGMSQIFTMDVLAERTRKEFSSSEYDARWADWSPNGQAIVFSQGSRTPWLIAKQSSSKNAPEVRLSEMTPIYNADYSPDNFWLVFETVQNGSSDLYLISANGGNLTPLMTETSEDFDPVWRPMP